ncbi:MAG: helix-turn-helix transcriptional regulator [Candidatus Desantisbacteria bacterium]
MKGLRIKIGNRIRELRKAQGLTQENLGEKAELHNTYIGGIERGERNLSLDSIEKIATGLNIEIKELFTFSPTTIPSQHETIISEIIELIKKGDTKTIEIISKALKEVLEWQKK